MVEHEKTAQGSMVSTGLLFNYDYTMLVVPILFTPFLPAHFIFTHKYFDMETAKAERRHFNVLPFFPCGRVEAFFKGILVK